MRKSMLAGLLVVGVVACGPDAPAGGTAATPAPATDPRATATEVPDDLPVVTDTDPHADIPEPTPPEIEPAPWSGEKIAAAAARGPYFEQWRKAGNRDLCAPVAPIDLAGHDDATPRAANFSGGWAVAYDEPGLRSAFGIAGSDADAGRASDSIWLDSITWADGSVASYGLEGGTGPGHLAYLEIAGQGCLYNVWSKHGAEHVVALLERLRFVATAPAPGDP
jgi:hypothetical protein